MSLPHTRLGDLGIGICPCHKVPVPYVVTFTSSTSSSISSDGVPEMALGSTGVASCGHTAVALSGSFLNSNNGLPVHRLSDTGINCGPYTATTGSPTTTSL